MKEDIRKKALELGFDACRVTSVEPPTHATFFQQWLNNGNHGEMGYLARNAHKRVDPRQVLGSARSLIVLAASYHREERALPTDGPHGVIARYAQFDDYHDVIGGRLKQLTHYINERAASAAQSLWYVDTGPLLERDLAQRAGIGFIGKHTNLISPKLGNWFFVSEIITTLQLEPDRPEENRCGKCARCISACPTGAITAPFNLDARRCISYLTIELKGPIPEELRPALGNRIYGCDDCLEACPWNRFAREGALMKSHVRADLGVPELIELLATDDVEFKKRFARTPILRTKRRGLLRNVCVALGNIGDETAIAALERAAGDTEPLIVEHARWALGRIHARSTAAKAS